MNIQAKFEVRIALPFPDIIAIDVLGGFERKEEAVGGRGWYRSKER